MMRDGGPRVDAPLAALAEAQHGVVGRRQLRGLGIEKAGIDSRVRRRALLPIHRGVYAVGHRRLTMEGRWMAAVLAAGRGAVLSHRSAGQLWGVLPRTAARPEVTRPGHFRRRSEILARRSPLPADEVDEASGIPVTSVSRTLLDLGAVLPAQRLEHALNQAEVLQLTSRLSLSELLDRYPGRRGTAAIRPAARGRQGGDRGDAA